MVVQREDTTGMGTILLEEVYWYVQNVSTFPNTFAIVSPLICVFW
jgi:hypothetical protein